MSDNKTNFMLTFNTDNASFDGGDGDAEIVRILTTARVFVTLAEAEAAEREWLADNDDDDDETYFGWVEKVEIDYPI